MKSPSQSSAAAPAGAALARHDAAAEARHRALRGQMLLRTGVAFLNHGAVGACPEPVFERYQAWQAEVEREPMVFFGRRYAELMDDARARLAAFLAAERDEVVYFMNVTGAVNTVARSLRLEPGDEVLTTNVEYGALEKAWQYVCERRGARLVARELPAEPASPEELVEAVWDGLSDRTRVLYMSHVAASTGLILPVEQLLARAREHGLVTVVDGAHAPGQLPLDLPAIGADFYAATCHKWLSAPIGAAFLYARPEAQELLEPLVVSWGWRSARPGPSRYVDEQQLWGTRDPSAFLAVPEAIDFQAEHDWPRVRAECHELVRYARARTRALTGLPDLVPEGDGWYAQMSAIPIPPCDGQALQWRLYDEHRVEVPVYEQDGACFIRLSVQGYNTREDVDRFVDALAAELQEQPTP
ncbi:MAG: aminotransferase class V-fold PLP-dependent enzyme [Conexibacter sp.]